MTENIDHEGFLELISTVDVKVKKKLITQATDREIESILDCFATVEPFIHRLKKCKQKFQKFKKSFQGKNFNLKKARTLFKKKSRVCCLCCCGCII